MSVFDRDISIAMMRESLDSIPQFALCEGYSCTWYEHGNDTAWVRINGAADVHNTITRELFEREFGVDERMLHERMCFLRDDRSGRLIGTATAWSNPDYRGASWGRLHWVAIEPEFQGRGLAKPMLTVVCNRLGDLGHGQAYLVTATVRFPAIMLYWMFGFRPQIRNDREKEVWDEILPRIKTGNRKSHPLSLPAPDERSEVR